MQNTEPQPSQTLQMYTITSHKHKHTVSVIGILSQDV